MDTIGIILVVVGAIIYYGTILMYKKNKKKVQFNPDKAGNDEFLTLLNNGAIVTKVIGALLVVAGAIMILAFR